MEHVNFKADTQEQLLAEVAAWLAEQLLDTACAQDPDFVIQGGDGGGPG